MKILLSASVKGGVGKTTVAVGVAQALHRLGYRVGVLDLDYRAPCVPILLNLEKVSLNRTSDDALVPVLAEGLYVFSMAFIWPPDKCIMVEDNDASDDVRQLMRPGVLAWPELDFLVVDTPPTSSGIVTTALETAQAAGALIISHPSRVSRADTVRTLDLFAEKQVPVYALISNQGVDEEGRRRYDLEDVDIAQLATTYGVPFFLAIPHTRNLDRYFDQLANTLVHMEPVTLPKPKVPEVAGWSKMIEIAMQLTKLK